MIDREDECAHNNKGDPQGYIDDIQSLKIKLTKGRTRNTEQKNDVGNDRDRDTIAPRLRFLFYLLLLSLFLLLLS